MPITRREILGVLILSLGFGLVGIDRFLISTMYPTIAHDLHLDYGDIGTITGALAIAWGASALIMGNLADRIGRRRVLVASLTVFSVLIGASGLAAGLGSLVFVRVIMGLADGAFTPASIAATIQLSPPERHGRNVGFQQTMLVLFGLGLSPLFVGLLLKHGVDWRYVFSIFLVPGLIVSWLTHRWIPQTRSSGGAASESTADWRCVLGFRNIRILMAGMFCWLTCLITTSAFLPSYLVNHLKLQTGQMGTVMSAIGFGAMTGTIVLSAISDKIGRKPVMVLASIGALAALVFLGTIGPVVHRLPDTDPTKDNLCVRNKIFQERRAGHGDIRSAGENRAAQYAATHELSTGIDPCRCHCRKHRRTRVLLVFDRFR
jgi:predicted MFS family arabinose efflux permease